MNDRDWLNAYNKGADDTRAAVVEWLRSIGGLDTLAGRVERGEYEE